MRRKRLARIICIQQKRSKFTSKFNRVKREIINFYMKLHREWAEIEIKEETKASHARKRVNVKQFSLTK